MRGGSRPGRSATINLTIYRGTREIGGSCVEVRSGATRLVLDVGLPLVDADRDPFDSRKALRSTREELIADGTIPPVPGLFAEDANPPDAVLLSHAHLDHVGLLPFTRPQVPVYATRGTSKMMFAGAVFAGQPGLDRTRYREVTPGRPFQVGELRVTAYPVDHSTFGSVAYLVEGGGKLLLYSGDLRTHGRKPGMARALIAGVAPRKVDVLVMEGTHFGSGRDDGTTEFGLEEVIVGHVRSAPGLVLASFSPLDVDRLVTFYRAARRGGRVFVADAYAALVFHLVAGQAAVPRPAAEYGVRVFFNDSFRQRDIEQLNRIFGPARVTPEEVLARPERHLMVFRPSMTAPDFGGRLPEHCRVIHSRWPGRLREPEWEELRAQVAAAGGDFLAEHASGHIYVRDIIELVRAIGPKAVVPIHTFEPAMFLDHFPNAVLLADGAPYSF